MRTRPQQHVENNGVALEPAVSKKVIARVGSLGLTLAAILGAACIACVLASVLFKVTFVVFRTGSMEPAYPVGALAAVREVPALSLKPGDVATVQRTAGSVPVTHRVVTVMPDAASADGAVLILKGDANESEDPVEYRVQSARQMLFAVPELGSWLMVGRSPWAIGGSTILLAGLMGWAFWPRQETVTPDADASDGGSSDAGVPDASAAEPVGEVPDGTAAPR